jgi:hypothetical protein
MQRYNRAWRKKAGSVVRVGGVPIPAEWFDADGNLTPEGRVEVAAMGLMAVGDARDLLPVGDL